MRRPLPLTVSEQCIDEIVEAANALAQRNNFLRSQSREPIARTKALIVDCRKTWQKIDQLALRGK